MDDTFGRNKLIVTIWSKNILSFPLKVTFLANLITSKYNQISDSHVTNWSWYQIRETVWLTLFGRNQLIAKFLLHKFHFETSKNSPSSQIWKSNFWKLIEKYFSFGNLVSAVTKSSKAEVTFLVLQEGYEPTCYQT